MYAPDAVPVAYRNMYNFATEIFEKGLLKLFFSVAKGFSQLG